MSVEDLKKYGRMAAENPDVRKRAKEIGLQNLNGQAEYARTLGLEFNDQDFAALAREMAPKSELSETELASVSGGVVTSVAAAVAGAAVGVATAVTAVTSTTSSGGW